MMSKILNSAQNKELLHGILAIIVLAMFSAVLIFLSRGRAIPEPVGQIITNFEECEKAGYPVGESHPRQCWTSDGRHFIEEIEEIISPEEYYGSSTYGRCQQDDDCQVSGCNLEICQSQAEGPLASICVYPDRPTPGQLNYGCRCVNQKCQWAK